MAAGARCALRIVGRCRACAARRFYASATPLEHTLQDIDSWLLPSRRPSHYAYVCEPSLAVERLVDIGHVDGIVRNCRSRGVRGITANVINGWLSDYELYKAASRRAAELQPVVSRGGQRDMCAEERRLFIENYSTAKSELRRLTPSVRSLLRLPNAALPEIAAECDGPDDDSGGRASVAPAAHTGALLSSNLASVDERTGHVYLLGGAELASQSLQRRARSAMQAAGYALFKMPYVVRPAVAEACGADMAAVAEWQVRDRPPPSVAGLRQLVLAGNSLPAYAAAFCRKFFSPKQRFPVLLCHVGPAYRQTTGGGSVSLYSSAQPQLATLVSMCQCDVDSDLAYGQTTAAVRTLLLGVVGVPEEALRLVTLPARRLRCVEAAAVAFEYRPPSGGTVELARVSYIGTYLSHRLRIYVAPDNDAPTERNVTPVCVNYASVDLTACLGALCDSGLGTGEAVATVVENVSNTWY